MDALAFALVILVVVCTASALAYVVYQRHGAPGSICRRPHICVRANDCFGFPHFVHVMEYCYFFTDIVLHHAHLNTLVEEPPAEYRSPYVDAFLKELEDKLGFQFAKKGASGASPDPTTTVKEFNHEGATLKLPFILDGEEVNGGEYVQWFQYADTARMMRDMIVQPNIPQTKLTIGLVNRKLESGRHLLNADAICEAVKNEFGIEVTQTCFETTAFKYQAQFFINHKIILGPHGAHLANIPFSQDNALFIEYCDEWQPYSYFSGLAYTTDKYHVILRPSHDTFPDIGNKKQSNTKQNMRGDVGKTIEVLRAYIRGSGTLPSKLTYLG